MDFINVGKIIGVPLWCFAKKVMTHLYVGSIMQMQYADIVWLYDSLFDVRKPSDLFSPDNMCRHPRMNSCNLIE